MDIWKCRRQGRFDEAESKLNQLLQREPNHLPALLLLLRVYAQDLQRPDKAQTQLQGLTQKQILITKGRKSNDQSSVRLPF